MQRANRLACGLGVLSLWAVLGELGCSQPEMQMDVPDLGVPFPSGTIQLSLPPVQLNAGQERTVCVTRKFPLDVAADIVKVEIRQTLSHHVILYRYGNSAMPPQLNDVPQDCTGLNILGGGGLKAPLFIGESADPAHNQLQLPPGVAYHFEPSDYYMLEVHMLNAYIKPATAVADAYLVPKAPDESVVYADMLFYNNTQGINLKHDQKQSGLPPNTATTIPAMFVEVPPDIKLFGLTTHQHRLGTSVIISQSDSATNPGTFITENKDWEHPPLYRLPDDKPMTFSPGTGLRWVCSYNNTTSSYIKFGESALSNEMCIIWGYYYPSQGFQVFWN